MASSGTRTDERQSTRLRMSAVERTVGMVAVLIWPDNRKLGTDLDLLGEFV